MFNQKLMSDFEVENKNGKRKVIYLKTHQRNDQDYEKILSTLQMSTIIF